MSTSKSAVPALPINTTASEVTTYSSPKKLSQPVPPTSPLPTSEKKRAFDLLYAKVDRLTQNFSLNEKIAYSGHQSQIEDSFLKIINVDPMKFISEGKVDEFKLKETYKSSAREFGVRIW